MCGARSHCGSGAFASLRGERHHRGMPFVDRDDAGGRLAQRLIHLAGPATVVLGLPRGGVPVAAQIADALGAPLDVIVVRKLGVPWQPELAMGAIGEGGARVENAEVLQACRITAAELAAVEERELLLLRSRAEQLRGDRDRIWIAGRIAIIVDDGIATGSTARAACAVARAQGAARVVLAVPVAPAESVRALSAEVDEIVCVETPHPFGAVGRSYADFTQVSDATVVRLLAERA